MRHFKNTAFITIVFLLLSAVDCLAQTEPISTDRPDQSDGVYTIPKNQIQVENGLTLAKGTVINNLMLRYGLGSSTEVRLLVDAGKEEGIRGLKPLTISAKQRLLEQQQKIIPAITLVGYVSFEKAASKNFQGNEIPFELKLAFENELDDQFSLGYNLGTSDKFKNLNFSFGVGYSPIENISTFVEYFSTFNRHDSEHNIDIGILFTATPVLQFDIACGRSIDDRDANFFTTFGVSYIIH